MPAPVLYPSKISLRKLSMTWSVATPTWVAPDSRRRAMLSTTPRAAPISMPAGSLLGGTAKKCRKSS